ncbi:MAG: hypothetical protein KJZ83_06940, partial [Burkholderiaceae bacterium]|nr:hypothetical protein [Burkholderiaceae bacterium]
VWTKITPQLGSSFHEKSQSANAIVATTTMPIPTANGGALISLNITHNSTAKPVTVAFNGAAALTIKTTTGADPEPGGLVAGMVVAGYKVGAEFRLLSEQASASIVAAAEAAAARAEAAAASVVSRVWFKTTTDLENDNAVMGYEGAGKQFEVEEGDIIDAGGFRAEVAADDEADPDLTTPALVNLFARPTQHGFINPEQYGLIGAGGNDHPKLQRALDSGHSVILAENYCLITEPLVMQTAGQRLYGTNPNGCLIYSTSETPHDVLQVFGTRCEISGLWLRGTMSGATSQEEMTAVVRLVCALADLHHLRIVSNTNLQGAGIILDDVDPRTGDPAGDGRYFHDIHHCWIGEPGLTFHSSIQTFMYNIGSHGNAFWSNRILSQGIDGAINKAAFRFGGTAGPGLNSGDRVFKNRIQCINGAAAGYGVDASQHTYDLRLEGNYFEKFASAILIRKTNDGPPSNLIASIVDNMNDNNTAFVTSLGAKRYIERGTQQLIEYLNGWNWRYSNQSELDLHAPSGADPILRISSSGVLQPQAIGSRESPLLNLTADNQVITPTSGQMRVSGNGVVRTGITLANPATQGRELTIFATSWAFTLDNDGGASGGQNIYFEQNESSITLGNGAGQVARIKFKWESNFIGGGAWVEESRTTRP